ncbi:hypothetical protein [Mastigocoleus sp. MO_188.B34]|nr:hypothetical protein [Mastigocoleus sp. MO_188.B34]MDJ0697686.1 hypothetical protein [Mastigocoleus sp. MO_188.B34]
MSQRTPARRAYVEYYAFLARLQRTESWQLLVKAVEMQATA